MWANTKMAVFWVAAPRSLLEAASISETTADFYQTTRRNNSKTAVFGMNAFFVRKETTTREKKPAN
jgi:predicted transcriptional regulator